MVRAGAAKHARSVARWRPQDVSADLFAPPSYLEYKLIWFSIRTETHQAVRSSTTPEVSRAINNATEVCAW